jgi:hypothetical protein
MVLRFTLEELLNKGLNMKLVLVVVPPKRLKNFHMQSIEYNDN